MVRCFVGFMLPESIKDRIKVAQKKIVSLPIKGKAVEDFNLHICFSFLGELDEKRVDTISCELNNISKEFSVFEIGLGEIKFIPTENYVRVLALDVFDGELLKNLGYLVKEKIGGDAKPPHVTLCRIKNITDKQNTIQKIKDIKIKIERIPFDRIQLIKSELRRTGPIYTVLHESLFKIS